MAALRKRAGHYIFALWFLSSFLWSPYGIGQTIIFSSCRLLRLPCVADADIHIFALWFLLSSSFFVPFLISASQTGCLPYFHTWCGLSANLGCRSETCCMRLAENAGHKKSPSRHYRTNLSGCIITTKACIDIQKKTCKTAIPPPHVLIIW